MKDSFVDYLLSANYYSLLTDESTDATILEQEVILYIFFLKKVNQSFSFSASKHQIVSMQND